MSLRHRRMLPMLRAREDKIPALVAAEADNEVLEAVVKFNHGPHELTICSPEGQVSLLNTLYCWSL